MAYKNKLRCVDWLVCFALIKLGVGYFFYDIQICRAFS